MMAEQPPLAAVNSEALEHFGIKGMHWGIRKAEESVKRVPSGLKIDASVHPSSHNAAIEVSNFMNDRYAFNITKVKSFVPGDYGFTHGHMANVETTPGRREGVINIHPGDLRDTLKYAEKIGWSGKECGTPKGLLMHESAHAFFHADLEKMIVGDQRVMAWGGNSKALETAMQASLKEADRRGIPPKDFTKALSGYAHKANVQEEVEAELFAQYHLSPNPPSFVKVWGQTLHKELGLDATPMREEEGNRD